MRSGASEMMDLWRAPLDWGAGARFAIIAAAAFFTLVDLFAAQAILPVLALRYSTGPAATSLAVNASAVGMAVAGLGVALFGRRLEHRRAITLALGLLAVPTLALAYAPNLAIFAALRFTQGLTMATAFGLTLAYLGERFSAADAAGAFAAYITGNVASNLVGRLVAAFVTGGFGLVTNFVLFAALNLAGALLIHLAIDRVPPMAGGGTAMSPLAALRANLSSPRLLAAFGVGFAILFAFLGVFTYINFVLARPPLALGMGGIGLAYLVFVPSIFTTPPAGRIAVALGPRHALWLGLAVAALGLPALLSPHLAVLIGGMVLVGAGTFFAQAVATGFVARAASVERGTASGLYLAFYFAGGVVGTAALGIVFEAGGWPGTVAGVGAALGVAAALGTRFSGRDVPLA